MKPGRELDALVAEKVMGWKRMSYDEAYPGNKYPSPERLTSYWHNDQSHEMARVTDDDERLAWSPSTNIAHVWEMVEKLMKKGWKLNIESSEEGYDTNHYRVFFHPKYILSDEISYFCEDPISAPHAICLAALGEFGSEVKNES